MQHIDKYIDCLNSDFQQIKQEISRRSNLQKAVLTGYIALLSYIFTRIIDMKMNWQIEIAMLIYLLLVQLYNYRESLEIQRLGKIISEKIAPALKEIIGLACVNQIYHSQTSPESIEYSTKKTRRFLSKTFNWTFLAFIPLVITSLYFFDNSFKDCKLTIIIILLLLISNIGITSFSEYHKSKTKK